MLQCNAKAYQSILQNPIALKAEMHFKNRPEYISNMLSKNLISKVKQVWGTLEDFSQTDTKSTEKNMLQKNNKINPFVIKSILES